MILGYVRQRQTDRIEMRIFVLGATPAFNMSEAPTLEERFKRTGHNSGNQVIAYGLLNNLRYDSAGWDATQSPQHVNANYDAVVVAAANFLFSGFDFGYLANYLEQITLPITVVGLGAQSSDFSSDVTLLPGTERMLSVMAERCKIIGVRGPYTQGVLARRNIHNVQVTGCPSYYADVGNTVPKELPPLPDRPRLAVNASRDVVSHAFDREAMISVVQRLMALAVEHDGLFVAQTESEEMALAEGAGDKADELAVDLYRKAFRPTGDPDRFVAWAKRGNRVFWQVDQWIAAMREMDFVVGTRFHGNIAGLLGGTPSLVVCHDTRTTEMCQFLNVPNIGLNDVSSATARELYERIDLGAYHRRRAELVPLFANFLTINGLVPADHVRNLSAA